MKIKIYSAVFFLSLLLTGCGTMMKDVITACDLGQDYDVFAQCIKSRYDRDGRQPNLTSVRAFYAHLDAITEAYKLKKITSAEAKASTYDAFNKTIQAGNDRIIDSIKSPVQTNCYRNGANTTCTSY